MALVYERLRLRKERHVQAHGPTAPPKISDFGLPVRLIDVCSTIDGSSKGSICFKAGAGRGWDFHVISHTWSLDVRNLSERIGKEVGLKAQAAGGTDTYSEAFQQADFSQESCYKRLIEFLQLLVPEGVREIWFDALCINQVDNKEKDREIQNMGSYYSESKGCYVILHGLGEGFKLWKENGALPRWFTRVWTFQEFMLPRRLYFIVEGLHPGLIAFVNRQINAKLKKGLCRCFLKGMRDDGQQQDLWGSTSNVLLRFLLLKLTAETPDTEHGGRITWGSASNGSVDETLISCSIDELCVECESAPMIRNAHIPNYKGAALYFVEREAYLGVMHLGASLEKSSYNEADKSVKEGLFHLYETLVKASWFKPQGSKTTWPLRFTVTEVRKRECSVEEDRVLGILALLGVQLPQVRSGKGLHGQLVEVAKVCNERMLLALCMTDAKPCSVVGMSWAPDFLAMPDSNPWNDYNMGRRRTEVEFDPEKLHVSDIGSLLISAKVVSGVVLPINALPITLTKEDPLFQSCYIEELPTPTHFLVIPNLKQNSDDINPNFQQLATLLTPGSLMPSISMDLCSFLPLELNVTKNSTSCGSLSFLLQFQLHWKARDSHVCHIQLPITITDNSLDLNQLEVSFRVKMVVLGTENEIFGENLLLCKIIMVCLSSTSGDGREEELHKIGMLSLKEKTQKYAGDVYIGTFMKANRRNCLIGGFGPNLNYHVTIEHSKKAEYYCDHLGSS